jgi:hypothetical protein
MAVKGSGKPGVEFLLTSQSHFNTFNRENMTFNNQEHPLAPLGEPYTVLTNRFELTMAAIPGSDPCWSWSWLKGVCCRLCPRQLPAGIIF